MDTITKKEIIDLLSGRFPNEPKKESDFQNDDMRLATRDSVIEQLKNGGIPIAPEEVIRHQSEECGCAHMYLDDLSVPRTEGNETYSLVGRIKALQKMMQEDRQQLCGNPDCTYIPMVKPIS
jgi:hypothetical protein